MNQVCICILLIRSIYLVHWHCSTKWTFLSTLKRERMEAMREWKTKVNQSEAIWCSASKKIANQRCIQVVFMDLGTGKYSANLGEIFPAALQSISTKAGAAGQWILVTISLWLAWMTLPPARNIPWSVITLQLVIPSVGKTVARGSWVALILRWGWYFMNSFSLGVLEGAPRGNKVPWIQRLKFPDLSDPTVQAPTLLTTCKQLQFKEDIYCLFKFDLIFSFCPLNQMLLARESSSSILLRKYHFTKHFRRYSTESSHRSFEPIG